MEQVKDFVKSGIDKMITDIETDITANKVKTVINQSYVKDLTTLFGDLSGATAQTKATIGGRIKTYFESHGFTVSLSGTTITITFNL